MCIFGNKNASVLLSQQTIGKTQFAIHFLFLKFCFPSKLQKKLEYREANLCAAQIIRYFSKEKKKFYEFAVKLLLHNIRNSEYQ